MGERERALLSRLQTLDRLLGQLQRFRASQGGPLEPDTDRLAAAERYLQQTIQCCIDTANYLCAYWLGERPSGPVEAFEGLRKRDLLSAPLTAWMQDMVRLRNRMVHIYWRGDVEAVSAAIEAQENFRHFAISVRAATQSP